MLYNLSMSDCIFCKIINKEIPSNIVYEDDDVIAILDISQVTRGHTLVMPKVHYDNFLSTPKEVMHKVLDVAQRIGQVDIAVLGAKGINILMNTNKEAGQTVMHFHVHVIPRYTSDVNFQITMKENTVDNNSLPVLADLIKNKL